MSSSRLSAHIGYLYGEFPLIERVNAARRAGFSAVEHPNPMAIPAREMRARLEEQGMAFAQMAAATGDGARGEKGLAALPGREADFRDALARSLDYAEAIGCPLVHPMAGVAEGDAARAADTYRANLRHAVEQCRGRPVRILVEAISEAAVPGYFMSRLEQAVAMADEIAPDEILLLADTFHAAANGTDLLAFIGAQAPRIGHVHIADHPGRHEPGTGNLAFEPVLRALLAAGYGRAIGFEYIPTAATDATLSWMAAWKDLLNA
ncbi:hydroxypyruvate isomerase family protein [Ancylobacter mangrovi]|uniref:hydroxypyruvate isomerase family protein n=1 Tax=Ancylobacter mangrovi TaxID=2972472 RepID=UPI00216263C4|nr:TIM barrel protein [Ancylobacter mangrovi]MCS0502059.1 TIM barrel protein [Ancylobacter mangrovi]